MNNLQTQSAYLIYTNAVLAITKTEHNAPTYIKTLTLCRLMVIHQDTLIEPNKLILQRLELLLIFWGYLLQQQSIEPKQTNESTKHKSIEIKLTTTLKTGA